MVSATLGYDVQFSILGSGSRGNSVYIATKKSALLIDAGFSGKQLIERLAGVGGDIDQVRGVLLTHEHNDHISGAGVLARRLRIPLFANEGTYRGGEKKLGKLHSRKEFTTGERFEFEDFEIRSFRTLHDTEDPVGFVVSDGNCSIGYCTDTGKVTHLMAARLRDCDCLILEFNHDPEMLKNGPYPLALQQRVRSSHGHLANEDAATFIKELQSDSLRYIVLAHLSETNNLPQIAYNAALRTQEGVCNMHNTIIVAGQDKAAALIDLSS